MDAVFGVYDVAPELDGDGDLPVVQFDEAFDDAEAQADAGPRRLLRELQAALAEVKTLRAILPPFPLRRRMTPSTPGADQSGRITRESIPDRTFGITR